MRRFRLSCLVAWRGKGVQINVADNVLTIKGEKKSEKEEKDKNYRLVERSYGSFARTLELPDFDLAQRSRALACLTRDMALQLTSVAYLWPALAAASAGAAATAFAREFAGLALGAPARRRKPSWTTPNRIALDLSTVRLRDFSTAAARPGTLVCAPFALHGATLVDFAHGHSLVAALTAGGIERIFVTDWRSAGPDMRFLSIDSYLADLNVLVDTIGPPVDLVGLCQGGWMALAYAARFPDKVRKLVLAGAPIDIAAGASDLSRLAAQTPMEVFRDLVNISEGRMLGRYALQVWEPAVVDAGAIREVLQVPREIKSAQWRRLEARFRAWYEWTLDLPGTYYLEAVERLFKQNQLARSEERRVGK